MSTVTPSRPSPLPHRASASRMEHCQHSPEPVVEPERHLSLADLAKHSCPKCHGRGYTGIDSTTRNQIPCGCALRTYAKVRKELVASQKQAPPPPPKKKGFFARIREKLRI